MKINIQSFLLVTVFLAADFVAQATDYTDHGETWKGICQGGETQSPIDLTVNDTMSLDIAFKLINYHEMTNATINVDEEGTRIIIIDPNLQHSYLQFKNISQENWRIFALRGMAWKVPSEHTVNGKPYSAELQIFHGMDSSDQIVALSFLFDSDLAIRQAANGTDHLKTCFVDSFKFCHFAQTPSHVVTSDARRLQDERTEAEKLAQDQKDKCHNKRDLMNPPPLDIPLKEFIEFVPQGNMTMYFGSLTEPSCSETVTWLVNLNAHVITQEQLTQIKRLLKKDQIPDLNEPKGGNWRSIADSENRPVFRFNNKANLEDMEKEGATALFTSLIAALITLATLM